MLHVFNTRVSILTQGNYKIKGRTNSSLKLHRENIFLFFIFVSYFTSAIYFNIVKYTNKRQTIYLVDMFKPLFRILNAILLKQIRILRSLSLLSKHNLIFASICHAFQAAEQTTTKHN